MQKKFQFAVVVPAYKNAEYDIQGMSYMCMSWDEVAREAKNLIELGDDAPYWYIREETDGPFHDRESFPW